METNYSKYIDHTILKPEATKEDVIKVCKESIQYGFCSVCVNPYYIDLVRGLLSGTNVKTCIVVGFPLGMDTKETKVFEAVQAVNKGADEIDMVINIGAIKNKDYVEVKEDINAVVQAVKNINKNIIVKVIIEACLLTDQEKVIVCKIIKEAGADFVKTSTGFSKSGATIEDVKLLRKEVGNDFGVKASGGIRTKQDLIEMIKAGASRVGASASVDIIKGISNTDNNNNKIVNPRPKY